MSLDDERRERLFVEEEYGLQLHRCSSSYIFDKVIKIMKLNIEEAVDELEEMISGKFPESNCQTEFSSLKAEFNASVNMNAPEIMSAIMKSLEIPPNVLLPEDAVQKTQYSDQDIEDIHRRTREFKERYIYNVQLKKALRAESDVLDCLEEAQKRVAEWQERSRQYSNELNAVKNATSSIIAVKDQRLDVRQRRIVLSPASETLEH